MSSSSLAQELIDAIVDEVPRENLNTCSLVAKSFRVPSQRRLLQVLALFTDRLLVPEPPKGSRILTRFEKARDMLAISPHLGRYVHVLELCFTPGQDFAAVESVLRSLSKLTTLAILPNRRSFDWQEMPLHVTSLLKDLIVHPALRCLSLTRIMSVPSSLIIHATSSLLAVSLCGIGIHDDVSSASPAYIGPVPDIYQYTHGLRYLNVRANATGDDVNWMRLLQDANATLIDVELSFRSPLPVLELLTFPALRALTLGFEVPNQTLPSALGHVLANLPVSAPHLESLAFKVETIAVFRSTWRGDIAPYPLFATADFQTQLPGLTNIHCCRNTGNIYDDNFETYVEQKLPGPHAAGILTFESCGR
ncbi:hypothetical protein DFH07DRAFT_943751 [Mycena maculata]|uniref:F-box domain-containing protein n=1 Tax=Mycena maculata TaxID=230809 RepID=A0AAD7N1P6_9AGAR|nr:hypothetical protein DFH07DRAFT_943751 [Mycena maculata]